MNVKYVSLAAILIVGLSAGIGVASVFWTTQLGARVTVVSSPYRTALYSDANCTVPLNVLDFGELVETQEGVVTSGWVDVYLQLEEVPTGIVYVHITTTGTLPDGAVIEGEKWRYVTSVYSPLDLNDGTCDGSIGATNPTVNGKVTEVFRFKIMMPVNEVGTYEGFGLEFTMTDSTVN